MATGKRYYWIKLKTSFLTSETVQFLMSQDNGNGANYVVLYQMLCLITINTDGKLERQIGEVIIPYDVEKIRQDCKYFSADTIRVAMDLYMKLGLIYRDANGCLEIANHQDLVGSETDWAVKKRRQAADKESPELPPSSRESGGENFPTEYRDKSIEKKSIESRDSTMEKDSSNSEIYNQEEDSTSVCTEPQAPPVLTMLLNTGEEYPFTQDFIDQMQAAYPAVDVLQEMRAMKAWCLSNPKKRKTSRGIKAFVNSWLSREQDRGWNRQQNTGKPTFMEINERKKQHDQR